MSPIEIRAYRITNIKVGGKELEAEPAVKIDEEGKEAPVKPGEFISLEKGQKLIIPDTRERVWAETDNSSFLLWRDMKPTPEASASVTLWAKTKGCGIARETGVETPFAKDRCITSDRKLEKDPAIVWTNQQKLVKVSWKPEEKKEEKRKEVTLFSSPRSSPRRQGEVQR